MRGGFEQHVESTLAPLRLCWSVMLVASFALAALGLLAAPVFSARGMPAEPPAPMVLATLGFVGAVFTLWVDRTVFTAMRMATLIKVPDYQLVRRHLLAGQLVLWSFAEVPALFGFAQLLLEGSLAVHLALCAASLAVLALLMPTRARVTARMAAVLH